jgi:salicylate hydroxylase
MRGELHLSHKLLSYDELPNEVVLQFQNGKTAACDLLIGADGLRSVVRRCFLSKQDPSRPLASDPIFWSGEHAFRGLVKVERLESEFPGHRACTEPVIVSVFH